MSTALALRGDQSFFDDKQLAVLRQLGVENASNADLALFFHVSVKTGLDPFARQIHMIGRNTKDQRTNQWVTKYTIQTGIDGYRLIARRAAGSAGYSYEETQWCGADGQWTDVWVSDESPVAAKVVVVRDGQRFPAVARYKAYVQTKRDGTPNSIWAQRDAEQLEKCAEALALRKAFPHDLSGIYTDDEMAVDRTPPREPQQARVTLTDLRPVEDATVVEHTPSGLDEFDAETTTWTEPPALITAAQSKKLHAALNDAGLGDRAAGLAYISATVGREVETSKELSKDDASRVIAALEAMLDPADDATIPGVDQ